jgi:hypothetical protein
VRRHPEDTEISGRTSHVTVTSGRILKQRSAQSNLKFVGTIAIPEVQHRGRERLPTYVALSVNDAPAHPAPGDLVKTNLEGFADGHAEHP